MVVDSLDWRVRGLVSSDDEDDGDDGMGMMGGPR